MAVNSYEVRTLDSNKQLCPRRRDAKVGLAVAGQIEPSQGDAAYNWLFKIAVVRLLPCHMTLRGVRGFSDYAGPTSHSRLTWLPCCLPPTRNEVGILIYGLFAAQ
ncbi:MAG TPA: hypothetical protein VH196_01155 [Terriglobales bacterium]|nr:hypothetical protein [Terriglobales bacterium]